MIGRTVGAYRVLAQLGEGGMGVVYKALDVRLQRHVALKALPAHASTEDLRRRFLQEARAASALNDPHIITIHDVLSEDGTDFLVMEFVEGRTLRDIVGDGPVPIESALDWTARIAGALSLAHAAGIVHRDLKPGNIMVTGRGLVKVLDFGIAKVAPRGEADTTGAMTRAGMVLGTVEYMSPEQARGGDVDHRSDIFSLGAILFELLTGKRPFQAANTFALVHAILHEPIRPVGTLRPDIPEQVDAIVRKALERSVTARYQTMDEIAGDLRAALSAASATRVLPATAATPVRGRGSRSWRWIAGAAVLAAIAIGIYPRVADWRGRGGARSTSAMPAPAVVAAPATAFEHTQVGLGLLQRFDRKGNVEKAIASFESAIALEKSFAPAWAGLARAYWRQQKATSDTAWNARAIDAARQAVTLDPFLAAGHVSLGFAHLAAADRPAAKAALEHALVLEPNNADAYRGLGDLVEGEGRLEEAARHYEKAVALNGADWDLARLAGTIPYRAGRYAEAVGWYERAAAAAPDSAVPQSLLGAAKHMQGDYAAAAAAFQRSIAIQPSATVYTNLGTALFYQGKYREALPAFEKAVEMMPSNPLMWGNAADAYRWVPGNRPREAESYRRAIQLIEEQLAKDPTHAQNRSRLAIYLAKSGNKTRALAELGRVLTPDVRDVNTIYRGAVTYELCGSREAALRTLETALQRGYPLDEVRRDPELSNLRNDVRYHRLTARFQAPAVAK